MSEITVIACFLLKILSIAFFLKVEILILIFIIQVLLIV